MSTIWKLHGKEGLRRVEKVEADAKASMASVFDLLSLKFELALFYY